MSKTKLTLYINIYIYAYTYNLKKSSQLYEEMGGHEKSWLTGRRTEKYYSYIIYWKINHLNEKCKDNIKKYIIKRQNIKIFSNKNICHKKLVYLANLGFYY